MKPNKSILVAIMAVVQKLLQQGAYEKANRSNARYQPKIHAGKGKMRKSRPKRKFHRQK